MYDEYYYQHCCGMVYVRSDEWLRFFGGIAERIKGDINPQTALDAGCAMGFLVETLRDRGIEAYGIDISQYAIEHVQENLRPFCRVASVLDPLPRAYDLIVCIEVLEHLTPQECEQAVDNFCRASDDILFSSTPDDYREATHINVQPPDYWAGLFARHGFYRDVEYDASYITGWAMRFRRAREPVHRLVEAYERRLWRLAQESSGARKFALESRNRLAEREGQLAQAQAERDAAQAQCVDALAQLDTAQSELKAARVQLQAERQTIAEILASPGWQFVTWVGRLRRRLFPPGSRRERWWTATVDKMSVRLKSSLGK